MFKHLSKHHQQFKSLNAPALLQTSKATVQQQKFKPCGECLNRFSHDPKTCVIRETCRKQKELGKIDRSLALLAIPFGASTLVFSYTTLLLLGNQNSAFVLSGFLTIFFGCCFVSSFSHHREKMKNWKTDWFPRNHSDW